MASQGFNVHQLTQLRGMVAELFEHGTAKQRSNYATMYYELQRLLFSHPDNAVEGEAFPEHTPRVKKAKPAAEPALSTGDEEDGVLLPDLTPAQSAEWKDEIPASEHDKSALSESAGTEGRRKHGKR